MWSAERVPSNKTKGTRTPAALTPIHRRAAGIDIGSRFHLVAVPPDLDAEPVRSFRGFTADLNQLADWLVSLGITTVAMESTGIYWVPVFEILEARGLEVVLVNARDAKNVPGRKTDVNDAQWIQQLHSYGLLRASFRPGAEIVALRAYLRHRERLIEYAASHAQHMQKALMQMNLQLHHVVSDITGVTGLKILRAIIGGERDPEVLAAHRDVRCKASVETICEALTGNYRPEHVFALRQAVELYDAYQAKLQDCDAEIERTVRALPQRETVAPPPPPRSRKVQRNEPRFDVHALLHAMLGVDLTQINGLGPSSALRIVAECGTDMTRWPTVKHFTSWLTLAPGTKISGGKVLSSRTRPSANRAAAMLRLAAVSVSRTSTGLGAFFRQLAARIGKAKAITATARKIAVFFYNTLRHGSAYVDPGANYYEERYRQRSIANLRRRADALGLTLVEGQAAAGAS
ncbi:IS110 family transposase [Sorangium sp. So ce204]|uniref:IS110 family transposase n=1 Tax=Sorangium sp. So ce204 TaxID=3133288 RepID=UPI003F5F9867